MPWQKPGSSLPGLPPQGVGHSELTWHHAILEPLPEGFVSRLRPFHVLAALEVMTTESGATPGPHSTVSQFSAAPPGSAQAQAPAGHFEGQ